MNPWRRVVCATLAAAAWPAVATEATAWQRERALFRLGYETVDLPAGEKMGLVGASYLVKVHDKLCLGPAVYGAASGQRGGLFTVGAEAALCTKLLDRLSLLAGLYIGGGGGGAAPVGGGLMLRPHADLMWDFGGWRAGVSLSKVRFPNGQIDSNQVGAVLDFDSDFDWLRSGAGSAPSGPRGGMGFDRIRAIAGAYRPRSGTLANSGKPLAATIALVGARAEADWRRAAYFGIETMAAASGGAAGYAELLGTAGVWLPLDPDQDLRLGARVALGMGGGGDIPVGGGLLAKAALNADWRLSRDLALAFEAGWATAPQGDFDAPYATAGLRWDFEPAQGAPARRARQEWSAGVEWVHDAARKAVPSQSLQQVSFRYTRFIGERLYLNGQVQSAYAGEAGGFSVGLFGVGALWRPHPGWLAGAEMAIGAAGGGGVDTGGGVVVKPMAFVGVNLSPQVSLRLGGGWIKAVDGGGLSSPVLDLTLNFAFDVGQRR